MKRFMKNCKVGGVTSASNRRVGFANAHTAPYRKFAFTLAEVFSPHPAGQRKCAFTLAEVFSPHPAGQRKCAFTLAEVLITLGIIGVVAAMTIPTLINKYQKQVYYNQFIKAASTIDNAINEYNSENGCGNFDIKYELYDNLCALSEDNQTSSLADKLGEKFKVSKWINNENYRDVCKGYLNLPPSYTYDGKNREPEGADYCYDDVETYYKNGSGFITTDGILIAFGDKGAGNGALVDVNGPDKGPNICGRDMFIMYIRNSPSKRWGYPKDEVYSCFGNDKTGDNCGIRLLQEGKMNY